MDTQASERIVTKHAEVGFSMADMPGLTVAAAGPSAPFTGEVPYVRWHGEGESDAFVLRVEAVQRCAANRLCAFCSKPLDYWIAFLDVEDGRDHRIPAVHSDCAYMWVADHEPWKSQPVVWMTKTRSYTVHYDRDGGMVVRAAPSRGAELVKNEPITPEHPVTFDPDSDPGPELQQMIREGFEDALRSSGETDAS